MMKYINIKNKEILDLTRLEQLKSNSMLKVNPHLFIEWDFENNQDLDIWKVTKGSDKYVNWVCKKCKSNYNTRIQLRDRGQGCPYCRGFKVNHTNSLGDTRKDLLALWNFELNLDISPYSVTCGLAKKVWWKCEKCKDTYPMAINKKAHGRGCSICAGYYVTKSNSFGGKYPELAKEWHPTKNGELTPYDVSYGSGKKVWWKCRHCESDYQLTVDKKTSKDYNPSSCSICSNGSSFGERLMFEILRHHNIHFLKEKTFNWSNNKRYDFYLPEHKTIIEIHGTQHYNGSFSRIGGRTLEQEISNDILKESLAKSNGIKNYIVIKSLDYDIYEFKQQILNSELKNILGVKDIDYDELKSLIFNNTIKETWDKYNEGFTVKEIEKLIPIKRSTIKRYIKLGKELNRIIS